MISYFERLLKEVLNRGQSSGGIEDPSTEDALKLLHVTQGVEWQDITEDQDLDPNLKTIAGKRSAVAGLSTPGTRKAILTNESPFKSGRIYSPRVRLTPNLVIMGNDPAQGAANALLANQTYVTNFGQQVRYKSWLYTIILGWTSASRVATQAFTPPIQHRLLTNIPDTDNSYSTPSTNEGKVAGKIVRTDNASATSYFITALDVSGSTTPVTLSRGLLMPRGWEMAVEFMSNANQFYDVALVFDVLG